jgi:hypothetical protein
MKTFRLSLFAVFLSLNVTVFAQPSIWTVNSRSDIFEGDARGVSIDANGAITQAPKFSKIYETGQPYVWASVIDPNGDVFLGTGGEGRIFKITSGGQGSLFSDLAEMNVSALALGSDGSLFAGTSPDGKVYKIDGKGAATVYFEPKEKYIWSLAIMSDGSLAVGTGDSGKIYRVPSANSSLESSLFFDTSETSIIALAADKSGNLYAGTDSEGLVLKFGPDAKPYALIDSPLREIHELTLGPDGSLYALAISEAVSTAKPAESSPSPKPAAKTATPAKPGAAVATPPAVKSRYDLTSAKSAVYRILPNGSNEIIWSSNSVVGFSIHPHQTGNGVLLGTSDKGRIYSISNDGREKLALQSDASQISGIFSQGSKLYATTSNQGAVFSIGPDSETNGIYESSVLDARSTADWGNIWWRSEGSVSIETRSGNTETPGETWSEWLRIPAGPARGKVSSPSARFVQWRAVLGSGSDTRLYEVSLAYAARNIAPEVLYITIIPANVGLLANPVPQLDPNIELSGLDPAAFGVAKAPAVARKVYLRGARAFQWTAEDRNGDDLVFDVYYKEARDSSYKLIEKNIDANFFTLDGLSLADGRYTLRIVAKDDRSNPVGKGMSGQMISEPFDIDNTQPTVSVVGSPQLNGTRARVVFRGADSSSYVVRAEYSVNGGAWRSVKPDDGISDSPEESYTVELNLPEAGEYSVTLRVFDVNGNVGNARATVKR